MSVFHRLVFSMLFGLTCLTASGCGRLVGTGHMLSGQVHMMMQSVPIDVTAIVASFIKGSVTRTLVLTVNSAAGTAEGIITNLSPGEWSITVEAKDATNLVLYKGAVTAIVQPARVVEVVLQLAQTSEAGLRNIVAIASKGEHALALKSNGTVWSWGNNYDGQLGDGTEFDRDTPIKVANLNGVIEIATGGFHSLALKGDHTLWAWGRNFDGQLGDGSTIDRSLPLQVYSLMDIVAVAGGALHSLAVKNDGTVWAWGDNASGQLGNGIGGKRLTPMQVNGLSGVKAVAAGHFHSVALSGDGTVWTWGDNYFGQGGTGYESASLMPTQVSNLTGVVAIAAGGYSTMVVKNDGTVWAWGNNSSGQLGDGTRIDRSAPVQVIGLQGAKAVDIASQWHSMALRNDGTVWAWGENYKGGLGDGTTTSRLTPVRVMTLADVAAITCGFYDTYALKSNGTVWAWGDNRYGQLGDGTTDFRSTPTQVTSGSSISYNVMMQLAPAGNP